MTFGWYGNKNQRDAIFYVNHADKPNIKVEPTFLELVVDNKLVLLSKVTVLRLVRANEEVRSNYGPDAAKLKLGIKKGIRRCIRQRDSGLW